MWLTIYALTTKVDEMWSKWCSCTVTAPATLQKIFWRTTHTGTNPTPVELIG